MFRHMNTLHVLRECALGTLLIKRAATKTLKYAPDYSLNVLVVDHLFKQSYFRCYRQPFRTMAGKPCQPLRYATIVLPRPSCAKPLGGDCVNMQ